MTRASNVEFHLQSNCALVAKECLAGHVRSGPARVCLCFIYYKMKWDFLVILTSSDSIMSRLLFQSMFSKSHDGLTNPLKQAALLCSNLSPMASLSYKERRRHCLALRDSYLL